MSCLPTTTLRPRSLDVELLADELQVLARRHFLLAVELRLLEVLGRDRALHLLDGDADAAVDLAELLAVAGLAQLGAGAGLVDQVDGLVGQEAVGDVAARLVDGGLDRLARVLDVVELLVAVLDAAGGSGSSPSRSADRTLTAWKRRSSERSFSMYLRYSAGVVAPMHRISPRRERRLQDVGGVERAFGRPGARPACAARR